MRFRIAIVLVILFVLAWTQTGSLQPRRETGMLPIDPPTPYIHYLPDVKPPRGRILVGHGLDAFKESMHMLSSAFVDAGFEVYAIDLPGHGDSPVGFEASPAQDAILRSYEYLGSNTTVIGHSLTGGLLLDLAANHHFSTMILLSPPPTPMSRIQADRVLIVAGGFEFPRISGFGSVVADVGGPHVEFRKLEWAGHSSAIFNPVYIRTIVEWLGASGRKAKTISRYAWMGIMLLAALGFAVLLVPAPPLDPERRTISSLLVRYVAACAASILILKLFVPFTFIRFFAADYLVSFLFLSGAVLWIQERPRVHINPQAIGKAAGAAAFMIGVIGFGVLSNVLHLSLSNGRWWRFPVIALAGFLLLTFDEFAIRRITPRWKSVAVAVITRGLMGAFLLIGVLQLNREAAFLVLIAHLMVLFWMILWITTEIVHRHTRDPFASAVYAALVQAWAFAAWFVKT